MNKLLRTAAFAAATSTVSWALSSWLGKRSARKAREARAIQTWEGEGGNVVRNVRPDAAQQSKQ